MADTSPNMPRPMRAVWVRLGAPMEWYIIGLGAVIGIVTAAGAVGFATLLGLTERAGHSFLSQWSVWLLPLLPMAGALATGVIVHFGAPEASGHGVPQVIDALARKQGEIPARVGVTKVIASICTVGSGGSAGAEGPIVQIGATLGSVVGRWIKIGREHRATLVGCGAAAGIASIFGAPLAGVFFVLEILLRDFSRRTLTPIVVASVFSTAVTQVMLGKNEAIFAVNLPSYGFSIAEFPAYIMLGLVCAVIAVGFTRLLHWGEDVYDKVPVHPVFKPVTGAALLGVLGIVFVLIAQAQGGHEHTPAFYGNGYGVIRQLLDPGQYSGSYPGMGARGIQGMIEAGESAALPIVAWMIALALVFKAMGTTLTLASGGSGGVFAPSLFLGATAGAVFGMVLGSIGLLPPTASPASYALVGMAAVVAGATFAPLTAILMIFELTREPLVLLPVMLSSIVAMIVASLYMPDSIYTMKLRQAGLLLSAGRDLTEPIHASDPLSKLVSLYADKNVPDFVVTEPETGRYIGMVTGADMRTALIDREAIPLLLVAELMRTDLPGVRRDETLDTVLDKFAMHDVASLCVVSPIDERLAMGVITRREVLRRYRQALEEHA